MNKKGFTLVELLAVLIIISIVSLITFPAIGSVIVRSRDNLYDIQILDIKKAAQKWSIEHPELLDATHANDIYIPLASFRYSGYLEPDPIKNPKDRTEMEGCIRIKYNIKEKKNIYDYEEKTCKTYANNQDDSNDYAYIIYEYDKSSETFNVSNDSNRLYSIGELIYDYYNTSNPTNKSIIKMSGETDSGLYDVDDEYVFRGSNVNNYVKLPDGSYFRILSINKKDYSVKLIGVSTVASNKWSDGTLDFKETKTSGISATLLSRINDDVAYNYDKIIDYDYQIGTVLNSSFSIDALKSQLSNKTTSSKSENEITISTSNTSSGKVGSISILDYVNASATIACPDDYLSNSCSNNNYIKDMFGNSNTTWTINNDGNQIWYINTNGILSLAQPNNNKQIYPVVKLDSSAYAINPSVSGSSTSNAFELR